MMRFRMGVALSILILAWNLASVADTRIKEIYDQEQNKKEWLKWLQTRDDMRNIGKAVEAYAVDTGKYPAAKLGDLKILTKILVPKYMKEVPQKDVWGSPLRYVCIDPDKTYWIISYGADGKPDAGIYKPDGTPLKDEKMQTDSLDADVVFEQGSLIRFPAQKEKY